MTLDVVEELLEVLRVIHDQLADYRFVQVQRGKFVGVALNNHRSHESEVLRDGGCTLLHDEHVLVLNFFQEAPICVNVLQQR